MKKSIAALSFIIICTGVWAAGNAGSNPASGGYHYQVYVRPDGYFGYDIFSGNKKMIHQDCIPGQPGNKGFTTKESAGKVAALVVSKIQHNIFPPTITTEELKQLHVL